MKKFAFCLLLTSFIATPAFAYHHKPSSYNPNFAHETFCPDRFSAINISNGINVYIDDKHTDHCIKVIGDPKTVARVTHTVNNNTLYLGLKPQKGNNNRFRLPPPRGYLSVFIHAPHLTQITHNGNGQVTGTYLQGNKAMQNIAYNGAGSLKFYWVNTPQIKIVGNGTGQIYLAGVTGLLDATLSNRTWLNAKYLHTEESFIKTRDYARADVWSRDNLSAYSTGHSTVYYYNDSDFVGGYMTPPGTILRMVGIDTRHYETAE